ncbi:MAG TPA: HEPN domain-containing protein [Syntrophomonadaceae bacterium]|nr:HEPN domain-containing protein [Syntrophomonadaceae bacterium]
MSKIPPEQEWFLQADYDLHTAKAMLRSKRYIYAVFLCHLALEKALKGLVAASTGEPPPRTHNLILLVKLAKPNLNHEQLTFLATLNTASIATRYPQELAQALKQYDRKMTKSYIKSTEEVIKCLRQDPRLKQ